MSIYNIKERFQKVLEPSAGSRRRPDIPKFAAVKRWGRVYFIAKKRRPLFEGALAKIQ